MIVLRNKEFSGEEYLKRKAQENLRKAIEEADILEEATEKGEKIFKKKGFLKKNKKALITAAGIGTGTALATLAAMKKEKNKE